MARSFFVPFLITALLLAPIGGATFAGGEEEAIPVRLDSLEMPTGFIPVNPSPFSDGEVEVSFGPASEGEISVLVENYGEEERSLGLLITAMRFSGSVYARMMPTEPETVSERRETVSLGAGETIEIRLSIEGLGLHPSDDPLLSESFVVSVEGKGGEISLRIDPSRIRNETL